MPRFRKKPVEVEARRFEDVVDLDVINELAGWCAGFGAVSPEREPFILIDTLEGTMTASPGDWIIRGIKGDFYPCKPDIFEATYEPVNEEE